MPRVSITTEASKHTVMRALRDLTVNADDFDHRPWSIWDAEQLEAAARMIRRGYAETGIQFDATQGGEVDRLRALIRHCWVHSGYPDCGYAQMASDQRDLYLRVIGREGKDA